MVMVMMMVMIVVVAVAVVKAVVVGVASQQRAARTARIGAAPGAGGGRCGATADRIAVRNEIGGRVNRDDRSRWHDRTGQRVIVAQQRSVPVLNGSDVGHMIRAQLVVQCVRILVCVVVVQVGQRSQSGGRARVRGDRQQIQIVRFDQIQSESAIVIQRTGRRVAVDRIVVTVRGNLGEGDQRRSRSERSGTLELPSHGLSCDRT